MLSMSNDRYAGCPPAFGGLLCLSLHPDPRPPLIHVGDAHPDCVRDSPILQSSTGHHGSRSVWFGERSMSPSSTAQGNGAPWV